MTTQFNFFSNFFHGDDVPNTLLSVIRFFIIFRLRGRRGRLIFKGYVFLASYLNNLTIYFSQGCTK
jgi:hypothetical protein